MKTRFIYSFIFFYAFTLSLTAQTVIDSSKIHSHHPKRQKQESQKQSAAQRAVQYSQELKVKLGLSGDQYAKILAVNTECITRKDALKSSTDAASIKDGKKQIKDYRATEFAKILSAGQLAKLNMMNDGNKH